MQLDGDELLKDMKQLVDAGWRYKGRGGNLAATKSLEHNTGSTISSQIDRPRRVKTFTVVSMRSLANPLKMLGANHPSA